MPVGFSMQALRVRDNLCDSAYLQFETVSLGLEVEQKAGPQKGWDQGQFRHKAGTLRGA